MHGAVMTTLSKQIQKIQILFLTILSSPFSSSTTLQISPNKIYRTSKQYFQVKSPGFPFLTHFAIFSKWNKCEKLYTQPPENCRVAKGPFINYVRVQREEGGFKKLYILLLWSGKVKSILTSICYIRNRAIKWFGRDHISFASGR